MVQKYLLAWNSYHWKVPGKHPLPSYTATSTLRQNMLSSAKMRPFLILKTWTNRRFDHLWSWKGTLIKTISKNRYFDVCSWWLTGDVTRKPWLTRAPKHPPDAWIPGGNCSRSISNLRASWFGRCEAFKQSAQNIITNKRSVELQYNYLCISNSLIYDLIINEYN